ncbi:MAG TPA: hypothetical protein DEP42_01900 [Ruminococcaceae bacterium]|nr:hypothetical protein [Oscillospiraceae bacterium]
MLGARDLEGSHFKKTGCHSKKVLTAVMRLVQGALSTIRMRQNFLLKETFIASCQKKGPAVIILRACFPIKEGEPSNNPVPSRGLWVLGKRIF